MESASAGFFNQLVLNGQGMATQIKICGLTRKEDVAAAVSLNVQALGFVFYAQSPRYVSPQQAQELIQSIPPSIAKVGLFVNATAEQVGQVLAVAEIDLLQFHGEETPEYCRQFGLMSMKAFRIRDAESLKELPKYPTEAWLLDAYSAENLGGTGEKFNWDLAVEAQKFGKPVFLAGGLTPENVAAAVRQVQPFGVDVSSGVESSPGKKDHAKVRAFIDNVRRAEKK